MEKFKKTYRKLYSKLQKIHGEIRVSREALNVALMAGDTAEAARIASHIHELGEALIENIESMRSLLSGGLGEDAAGVWRDYAAAWQNYLERFCKWLPARATAEVGVN